MGGMVVQAKDCYDPTDYVMVHKDYLANLQYLAARSIESEPQIVADPLPPQEGG